MGKIGVAIRPKAVQLSEKVSPGKTNPTQVTPMQNDDFFASSEANRAGQMPSEVGGMQATETQTEYQGKPYWTKSLQERLMTDLPTTLNELSTLKRPGVKAAAEGYFGKDLDVGSYVIRTQNNKGGWDFSDDSERLNRDAERFASSMLGAGNFGSKEHEQQQRSYENEMLKAGNDAGFSGEKLANFVREGVFNMAKNDYIRNARSAGAKRMENEKEDPYRKGSAGITINNLGGGKYQTKTGFYQVDRGKSDVETREQQFRNFVERNKQNIINNWAARYKKYPKGASDDEKRDIDIKAEERATEYYNSEKGQAAVNELFNKGRSEDKKVTKIYPAFTPKQDGSNPEVNVVDSKGRNISFTPSYYIIDEETNKPISIYGVEVVKEKSADGVTKNIQKPVVIPYNAKNKTVNNIAPDLANVYKNEIGRDLNLNVDENVEQSSGGKSNTKQYKISDVTVDFVKNLKDGEIVFVEGIERVKKDGKLKKVKR